MVIFLLMFLDKFQLISILPLTSFAEIISGWYSWGVAIAFAVTFVTTLWIFFDSQSNGYQASFLRWLSLLAAVVVIPSVILSFSPHLIISLPAVLSDALAVLGVSATVVSLLCLVLYGLGIGIVAPDTGPTDPSSSLAEQDKNAGIAEGRVGVRPITPPRGVQPITSEKSLTPQRITPTLSDTIRIKNAYENELPLAWIVVLNGPFAGREYRLQKIIDIGRESELNDVALDDRTVSRQHARIRYEKGAFVIYDLASANGVLVNGEKAQRRVLTHGDRIKLGQVMLGVLMVDEELDAAPPTDATIVQPFSEEA